MVLENDNIYEIEEEHYRKCREIVGYTQKRNLI